MAPSPKAVAPTCSGRSRTKRATGIRITAHAIRTMPKAVAVDDRPAERTAQPKREDAERDREGDRRPRPAELGLERRDDHARSRAHGLRREQREERDDDNDPRVVEALHG